MRRALGIETSCDETAVAVVTLDVSGFCVEKQLIASQIPDHAAYGGVVPEVAARLHAEVLPRLFFELDLPSLLPTIDLIAVTYGPGLAPALRVGVESAKTLSFLTGKPLVGVNHLEGHIASSWLAGVGAPAPEDMPALPALVLIVSGGHTEWILMTEMGTYKKVGETRDDACGEAYDKVAKRIGLAYPGGPKVAALADLGNPKAIAFPRPMIHTQDGEVSFSGLKTAVSTHLQTFPDTTKEDLCASFQAAAIDLLCSKTHFLLRTFPVQSLLVVGGVSANTVLRTSCREVADKAGIPVFFPHLAYTGDNAAMIAAAGLWHRTTDSWIDLRATPNLSL